MGLKPDTARWFEILVPREQLTATLECLATTEAVELQTHSQTEAVIIVPDLEEALSVHADRTRRFGPWWPDPEIPPVEEASEPALLLEEAERRIAAWEADAGDPVLELQGIDSEMDQLAILHHALETTDLELPDLAGMAEAGPVLDTRLFRLPPGAVPDTLPTTTLVEWFTASGQAFLLAAGPAEQIQQLDALMAALKARQIRIPAWLPHETPAALAAIDANSAKLQDRRGELRKQLEELAGRHELPRALGDMTLLAWFAEHAPKLPVTEHFAWVTGWTSDPDGVLLERELQSHRIDYLLRFSDSPPGAVSPVVLRNPAWAKAFELFPNLLGTPASGEADPSRFVALIAPLLFGYMFGDVGQGAVLLAAGLWLRRRYPVFALLVPGGIMSMVFGVLFGSVFCREDVIPALWLHPLEHPLPVLGVTLAGGVVVVGLGLCLDGLQSVWQGQGRRWFATRAGIAVAYFGLVAAIFLPAMLWVVIAGLAWFLIGVAITEGPGGLPGAAGHLAETALQLGVNTISFVRVGAFALAHAGLSAAIVGLADSFDSPVAVLPVMILGNALIIALEGLVVGIQTTRLVLFEFFIRFLSAEGRPFKPLHPPSVAMEHKRRKFS
jgi:V/A-type H+-transporting ATPase subunit I